MVVQSNWSCMPTILLLGFYVDVSEKTSFQPETLRLRLSGLKSRAHLIRKYSFPSCQAQSSLHALSRLYVQKGFALSDIHSALWPTNTSGDRLLCVGSPLFPRVCEFSVFQFFIFSFKAGGRPTCTADSLFHSTWCCMAPNQGRWNRKSDFSNTFELGRDAYRETVEQYLSQKSWLKPNFHHLAIRYVDSRFVIVQKHHLHAPVFKVFTDLDFYGSPVELELVADNFTSRLLCWCSERTIISAGTLRLRLSGLKSRAHLIRKYSFPSCQAQSSLHALSRLYVQKGFCSQDMWTTDSFCLTTVFAPHCPCECFPIVSFIKRRWSWKPSKMVHSLGSTIDVVQRTVRYQVPPLWEIRHLHSAGSMRLRLSGLKSRATLIRRYTFPKEFVRDDLNQLIQLYGTERFSKTDCQRVLYRRQLKHT